MFAAEVVEAKKDGLHGVVVGHSLGMGGSEASESLQASPKFLIEALDMAGAVSAIFGIPLEGSLLNGHYRAGGIADRVLHVGEALDELAIRLILAFCHEIRIFRTKYTRPRRGNCVLMMADTGPSSNR
jgi:hypothetical protein